MITSLFRGVAARTLFASPPTRDGVASLFSSTFPDGFGIEMDSVSKPLGGRVEEMGSKPTRAEKKLLIVPGANGVVAKEVIKKALSDGITVAALTGDPEKAEADYGVKPEGLNFLPIRHADYLLSDKVTDTLEPFLSEMGSFDEIGIVNTLGGTTSSLGAPDCSDKLYAKNIQAPISFVKGALKATSDKAHSVSVAHLSSIVASLVEDVESCPYSKVRIDCEKQLAAISAKAGVKSLTHCRIGIVQAAPKQHPTTGKTIVDSGHNHSAEHWAGKKVIFAVGADDKSLHRPVAMDCVADGIVAAAFRDNGPQNWAVDFVGPDSFTQREFFTFFSGGKVLSVHLPHNVMDLVAKTISVGRLQPYSMSVIKATEESSKTLCPSNFETLLGRAPVSMDKLYASIETLEKGDFVHPGPEIMSFAGKFFGALVQSPKLILDLGKAFINPTRGYGVSLVGKKMSPDTPGERDIIFASQKKFSV